MSNKPSGWSAWNHKQGHSSVYDRHHASGNLDRFAGSSHEVASRMRSLGMAEKDEIFGDVTYNRAKVEKEAKLFVRDSQDAEMDRQSFASTFRTARGQLPVDAERAVNHDMAVTARAILTAAKLSNAKLTDAQTRRLETASKGGYLNMVYRQYSSGDKGTAYVAPHFAENRNQSYTSRLDARNEFLNTIARGTQRYG